MRKIYFLAFSILASASLMATQVKVAVGTDLQAVVNGASSGDTVLVQAGIYEGNFTMVDGVYVSGGWNADFTTQTQYASILDAKQSGRVLNQPEDFNTLTIWDNFTIQGGNASDNHGGGASLQANGRLENCIIEDNKTTNSKMGGGCALTNGGQLYNCVIRNNTADGNGGGVRTWNDATIVNCLIADNTANGTGGGIYIQQHENNVGTSKLAKIIHCTIVNNNQTKSEPTDAEKTYCGIRCDVKEEADQLFVNNVIWGNKVNGVVGDQQMNDKIVNYNTRTGNAFHGTVPSGYNSGANAQVSLSQNNTDADKGPFFKDPSNGDYSMTYQSKLIDQKEYVAESGSVDLAGNSRLVNEKVDLGCYEFQWTKTHKEVKQGDDLQDSIDITFPGYTVKVQAGTYVGNFTMKDGVYVSGGWNADFTAQTEHASILDAKASGRVLNQPADFATLTVWNNFTIKNGKLTAEAADKLGSGVVLKKNGRVANCLIQDNTFEHNGTAQGGGIGQDSGTRNDTCAINCIVRNNQATHGGGVRIRGVILNSVIENNRTTNNAAGGVQLHGGAAYNCIIRNNISQNNVGGVRLYGACDLVNCLVADNEAQGNTGGVGCENNPSNIINCTIVRNKQGSAGGESIACGLRSNVNNAANYTGKLFINNVVWGNKVGDEVQAEQVHAYLKHYVTNGTFANNAFQGVTDLGVTYIQLSAENDPQFDANYECAATSPLYNAGNNDALTYLVGDKDVYGNARVQNGAIEIGAVECAVALLADGDNSVVIEANKDMKTNVLLKRTFKANDGYYTICLPFDIAASEIGQAFQVKSILDAGAEGFNVEFKEVEELEAGEPYLIKPKDLTNPTFEDVMIKNVSATANEVTGAGIKVAFTGVINGGGETNGTTEYWVGNGGYLYNNKTAKLGLRAFFTITDAEGNPTKVRARVVTSENETAGFENITIGAEVVKTIENGQLIIIRGGEKFNAMGVKL